MSQEIPRDDFLNLPSEIQYVILSKLDIDELEDLQKNLNPSENLYAMVSDIIPFALAEEIVENLSDHNYTGDVIYTRLHELINSDIYRDGIFFDRYPGNADVPHILQNIGPELAQETSMGFEFEGGQYIMFIQLIDETEQPYDSARYNLSRSELVNVLGQLIKLELPILAGGHNITEYN